MRLRYTRQARRHLDAIAEYIAERNPAAARGVGERIREAITVPGLPYVVVYRLELADPNTVTILGVYHGAQLRPGQQKR